MKTFLSILAIATALILGSTEKANAQYVGQPIRVLFGATNVGTATWVPIITPQTSRQIKGVMVSNTSGSVLQIGIAPGGSTANTEAVKAIVPNGLTAPVYYPMQISGGYRISLLAYSTTATTGEGDFSFLY